ADRLGEPRARLMEREIERRSFERPAAVAADDVVLRGSFEQVERRQPQRKLPEAAGERPGLARALREQVARLERDLLALPVLTTALEVDDRRCPVAALVDEVRDALVLDRERQLLPVAPEHLSRLRAGGRTVRLR